MASDVTSTLHQWTHDEIVLLLQVASTYKKEKQHVCVDDTDTKYEDICQKFIESYPQVDMSDGKFPCAGMAHTVFNKSTIEEKLVSLKEEYAAVTKSDGKSSGKTHIYYNDMHYLWCGYPAPIPHIDVGSNAGDSDCCDCSYCDCCDDCDCCNDCDCSDLFFCFDLCD